jgi:hypothetical protein
MSTESFTPRLHELVQELSELTYKKPYTNMHKHTGPLKPTCIELYKPTTQTQTGSGSNTYRKPYKNT